MQAFKCPEKKPRMVFPEEKNFCPSPNLLFAFYLVYCWKSVAEAALDTLDTKKENEQRKLGILRNGVMAALGSCWLLMT